MIYILKNIPTKQNRLDKKRVCELWLNPAALTAKQIRDTINDFDTAIEFTLDPDTYEDRLVSFISSHIDDITEMKISEKEKEQRILEHIHKYPEDTKIISNFCFQNF